MKRLPLALSAAVLVAAPGLALAGGGNGPDSVFVHVLRPDAPLEPYAGGQLGVLQPSFAYSYLVVAHRYLNGEPLDAEEQKAVLAVWSDRMRIGLRGRTEAYLPSSYERWHQARSALPGVGPPLESTYRLRPALLAYYLNCTDSAFENALATLEARAATYGASSAQLRAWVVAQDRVFANCSGRKSILPDPPRADAGPLERADRAYQIASAHFYAEEYEEAERSFRAIGRDSSSPWRRLAPYLAVRALVRQAMLAAPDDTTRRSLLGRAVGELEALLADQDRKGIHPACRRLLGYVKYHYDPPGRLLELARAITKRGSPTLKQDLWDYSSLLSRLVEPLARATDGATMSRRASEIDVIVAGDDMTRWILAFELGTRERALQGWRSSGSTAWLVAALSKISAEHPAVEELMTAAGRVPPSSPAAITLAYHVARLKAARGYRAEARAVLDTALAQDVVSYSRSSFNLLEDKRAMLATDLDDLLGHLVRYPAGFEDSSMDLSSDAAERVPRVGMEGLRILNRLPLNRLVEAASRPLLVPPLRRQVAAAAWVRAIVLSDDETLAVLTRLLREMGTDLELEPVAASRDSDSRRFAALMALLERPYWPVVAETPFRSLEWSRSASPRHVGWWCPIYDNDGETALASAEFLSGVERRVAQKQWTLVLAAGSGPRFFLTRAIEFAEKRPDDPRVPKALHLAVASSRWACPYEDGLGDVSRRAFRVLHTRYRRSPWTDRTKYWYDGSW